MLLLLVLPLCFFAADGLSFLSFSALKDCPNIPAQRNLQVDQISGSWRLAYLYYDEDEDIEEDGSCIVTEFTPLGETQMSIVVHMDLVGDDFTVDRTSVDLLASFHTPGEWLLHSNLSHTAYLHVKVLHLTKHHMVLMFCISNATDTDEYSGKDWGYTYILQKLKGDVKGKHSLKRKSNEPKDVSSDLSALFGRRSYFRRRRSLLNLDRLGDKSAAFGPNSQLKNYEDTSNKHFWTVVLVKDNNVSALKFIENASLLMRLGFDITSGNLISFGKCGV